MAVARRDYASAAAAANDSACGTQVRTQNGGATKAKGVKTVRICQ